MTYTEDSYGMDGKVNLPSLTADINWQGLEDLYSVNESLYTDRQNYRLSLGDWTNYLKDVDRVFALLNSHQEQNITNKPKTAQMDEFPAVSAEHSLPAEMASADLDEDRMQMAGEVPHLTLPTDLQTLHLNRPIFNPESKLEWNNDIPEVSHLNSEHWRNHKTEEWVGHEEINDLESDFSGNGMNALAPQPSPRLQTNNWLQQEYPQDDGPEDVFKDQLSLPTHSDVDSTIHVSTVEQSANSSSAEKKLNKVEKKHKGGNFQSPEGSAAFPLSSD